MTMANTAISDLPITHPDSMARIDALADLGLDTEADDDAIRAAFRNRLKEAHPDLTGGTDVLLRRIILARDLLMSQSRQSAEKAQWLQDFANSDYDADGALLLTITLDQAIYGGDAVQSVPALEVTAAHEELTSLTDMKRLKITLPAGLRDGDKLRLKTEGASRPEQLFRIHIVTDHGHVEGNDIHVLARVEARILLAGGRTVVATPHGPREVDVLRGEKALCLKGLGLPATQRYGCGDLHIRLEAGAEIRRPWSEAHADFRQKWAC